MLSGGELCENIRFVLCVCLYCVEDRWIVGALSNIAPFPGLKTGHVDHLYLAVESRDSKLLKVLLLLSCGSFFLSS